MEYEARQAGTAINDWLPENADTDCDAAAAALDAFGFDPSPDTARTYSTPSAGVIQVVVGHNANNAITATFNGDTGQVA